MGFVINSKDLFSYLALCFPKSGRSNSGKGFGRDGEEGFHHQSLWAVAGAQGLSLQEPAWGCLFSLFYFIFLKTDFLPGVFMP